jgi:hypothetical protein
MERFPSNHELGQSSNIISEGQISINLRWMILSLLLLAVPVTMHAAAERSSFSDLLGIPYLASSDPLTREEAKSQLRSIIMKRLAELQNWPGEYESLKTNKAIAIRYGAPYPNPFIPYLYRQEYLKPHIGYWGGA